MTITAILQQPDEGALVAAHRPIVFRVRSGGVVPTGQPAYCDVYIAGVFYKTLTAYSYERTNTGTDDHSIYEFDIQETCQEYLQTVQLLTPPTAPFRVESMTAGSETNKHISKVYCKFRGSTIDSDGILIPEPTIPVQGTDTSDPIPGTGTMSHTVRVLKATLRTMDNPDLQLHLDSLRLPVTYDGTDYTYFNAWPLTNVPYNRTAKVVPYVSVVMPQPTDDPDKAVDMYYGDHGWLPVYIPFGLPTDCRIAVQLYKSPNSVFDYQFEFYTFPATIAAGIWYFPVGQVDIEALIGAPLGRWKKPGEYPYYRIVMYAELPDPNCYFVSPMYKHIGRGYSNIRLWFQNNFGVFEQISFIRTDAAYKTSSKTARNIFGTAAGTPGAAIGKMAYNKRQMVTSDNLYEASAVFSEPMMPWVEELLASSIVMMEVPDPEAAYNAAPPALIPVVITDSTVDVLKSDERHSYQVTIKYSNSIVNNHIRN